MSGRLLPVGKEMFLPYVVLLLQIKRQAIGLYQPRPVLSSYIHDFDLIMNIFL